MAFSPPRNYEGKWINAPAKNSNARVNNEYR